MQAGVETISLAAQCSALEQKKPAASRGDVHRRFGGGRCSVRPSAEIFRLQIAPKATTAKGEG